MFDFFDAHIEEMIAKQHSGYTFTPSRVIHFFGQKLNDDNSIVCTCAKNNIPIFCPAITDGIFGNYLTKHYQNLDFMQSK